MSQYVLLKMGANPDISMWVVALEYSIKLIGYSRSLQAANDVEGCVGILVYLGNRGFTYPYSHSLRILTQKSVFS